MYKKILIANRGEIALRIIRACRELNIKTVAVYSIEDELSLHTKFADEAICIGPGPSTQSYLSIPAIISAAELTNADAIHPGYGFLSESAKFSAICDEHNISFIGPPADTIDGMGDKASAKKTMESVGVPVIPGSNGILNTPAEAIISAEESGYPIMLKATAGGGGRGMRFVKSEAELEKAFDSAQSESKIAFNNGDLYLEKFIEEPRHIEIQILADTAGNVVALGERECSIQRRHQKLIEESPSSAVTKELREEMSAAAIKGAKAVNYVGAGTIEFLLDKYGKFYFMEMNTRIQVEHPVSEMVTGIDIIKEQIWIAFTGETALKQSDINPRGHAIECRINAEDPSKNFQPSPGTIEMCHQPSGFRTRVDGAIFQGYKVTPFYDSMVCKLICHGRNRIEAIQRMNRSLDEFVIEGITTTIPLHKKLLNHKTFINSDFNVRWLDNEKIV